MATKFEGFPMEGMTFLEQLPKNNRRDWFQARKDIFEGCVKTPMIRLVESINSDLAIFAPEYRIADPAKSISRIYRDTRFSKDKSPYRTSISAVFPRGGANREEVAGFFFGVSVEGIEVIGGAYMPGPPELMRLRTTLAEKHVDFMKLENAKPLRESMGPLQGEQLQRVPRGFSPDHPAADLLRRKQFYFRTRLDAALATTGKLQHEIVKRFKAMTPLVEFLDAALASKAVRGRNT